MELHRERSAPAGCAAGLFGMCQLGICLANCKAQVEQNYVLTEESQFSVSKTTRPDFLKLGNKTARAVKLCTVRDIVASDRKGFMKKVHRRPGCQD